MIEPLQPTAESLVGELVQVEVGAVAHGGFCIARHDGRAVFVRHSLPGEEVIARITEGHQNSRFLRADAVEVVRASPDRVEAVCAAAGPGGCGGCDWQHASLPAQRTLKAAVIREQLQRLAGVDWPVVVEEIADPPQGLNWRTRVRFAVDEQGRLGLRRHRSHEVIALQECPIAHPDIAHSGVLTMQWPDAESVVAATSSTSAGESSNVSVIAEYPGGEQHLVMGTGECTHHALGRVWHTAADGFWQVHPGAAEALAAAVVEAADVQVGDVVWDLYAGAGLFAGALAGLATSVLAVESDAGACADARGNLTDLGNVRVEHARVDRWVRSAIAEESTAQRPDIVVVDPPRKGAGKSVVQSLMKAGPRRVIYVACDPATLARDIALFAEGGYALSRLRAFDLFPMTHHVECVAVLAR
ncbi:MAG TPA: tRNA/tmRNA/rRNA uracil-C5-methylase [Actinobacteria bacterium]|nr:tRNA/tmRNA/rRNA uracil-C5-methylase [Actinomycetota bacterium]